MILSREALEVAHDFGELRMAGFQKGNGIGNGLIVARRDVGARETQGIERKQNLAVRVHTRQVSPTPTTVQPVGSDPSKSLPWQ